MAIDLSDPNDPHHEEYLLMLEDDKKYAEWMARQEFPISEKSKKGLDELVWDTSAHPWMLNIDLVEMARSYEGEEMRATVNGHERRWHVAGEIIAK